MKRFTIATIACALLAVGIFAVTSRQQTRLTVLLNGVPAANLAVTDFQSMSPRKLDATGSVTYDREKLKLNAVLVPTGSGSKRMVSLPERGHKTVDLRGRLVVSRIVRYDFGLIRREEINEQYDLSDAETAAIEAGELTMSEVQESIRKVAEP